ncbi:hypothetical protein BCV00_16060 [Vibrio breoganii]|nr:hypothetical protein BCV00_16060 [Vibrio breoganii]
MIVYQVQIRLLACAVIISLSYNSPTFADSFDELSEASSKSKQSFNQNKQEFYQWLDDYFSEYEQWRDEYTKELDKKRILLIEDWGTAELSDSKKFVEYDSDNRVRKVIDYDNNTATISVMVDSSDLNRTFNAEDNLNKNTLIDGQELDFTKASTTKSFVGYSYENEQKEKDFVIAQVESQLQELDKQAERLILANTGAPDSFIQERAYNKKKALLVNATQRINVIVEKYNALRKTTPVNTTKEPLQVMNTAQGTASVEPVLAQSDAIDTKPAVVETTEKQAIVTAELSEVVTNSSNAEQAPAHDLTKISTDTDVKPSTLVEQASKQKTIVSYTIKLPESNLKARASSYLPLATEESNRWKVDTSLIMAIMHSESAFRPDAKSHIPAFGLMQVVPSSAGHDVNKQVRNIDAPMKESDLYLPPVNVETGTAYLNILNKKYLKSIDDDKSRLYCVIAAYNTGAGNVARAFNENRSTNISKASKIINQMSPSEVYEHLYNNLPYDETKNYLKKVTSRISLYEENKG